MNSPLVSVIIPTRNHSQFLGRCLRSLFSQVNAPRFEVIVFDDGSTDHSRMILEAFRSEILLLTSDSNLGLPTALNRAISASVGDYVVRLDSDDYVSKNFVSTLSLALEANPEMNAIACDYIEFRDSSGDYEIKNCLEFPIACGIMFRRSSLDSVGPYNEEFLRHEDREFRQRYEQRFTIERLPIPLYRYRRHDSNITNDQQLMDEYAARLTKGSN